MSDDYGQRIPTHEDIAAIAEYVDAMTGVMTSASSLRKVFDRAEGVFEVYVEQFRRSENG